MPRNNDKLFPCEQCRFNVDGHCRRNPPESTHQAVAIQDGHGKVAAISWWTPAVGGCFAGEPKVDRCCNTCDGHWTCGIEYQARDDGFNLSEWYCSDWAPKEEVSE